MSRPSLLRSLPIRAALLPAALLALSACSLAPVYERPPAPVAAAFPDAASATAGAVATTTPAADLAWADFVAEPRLARLVQTALANNRDLRAAVATVEQTRALYGVQRADRLPTVALGVTGERGTGIQTVYTAGLAVSAFELDLFGRVRDLSDAALARYFASDEGRRAAQMALVASVVNADLAVRADDDLLAITRRTLESRVEAFDLTRLRFEGGVSAEPEFQSANSLVASARANVFALERQRRQDVNALVLLLGQPLPDDLPAPAPLDQVSFTDLPAGLPSDVLLRRPDVRQAEQTLTAANANIGAARAAFFPRISLTGSVGTASIALSKLFESGAWYFAPSVTLPLFDYGRNRANLEASRAARDVAVAQYEKAVQTAFREVADALAGRATLSDQLAAQRAQATAESRRLELAELLFRGGTATALDRLDAERSALAARQAVVQLQLAQLQNAVLLYRVLGGGAGPETSPTAGGDSTPQP